MKEYKSGRIIHSYAYNDCVAALIEPKAMDDHFNALQLLTARPVLRKPEQGRKV